ncbi:AMP-binding protein [Massilia sp. W12]|uniref:AMP-binding protein n=1 Tax=Massilia sp. W12 TaxID=3126507 RepID=UPI0030CF4095
MHDALAHASARAGAALHPAQQGLYLAQNLAAEAPWFWGAESCLLPSASQSHAQAAWQACLDSSSALAQQLHPAPGQDGGAIMRHAGAPCAIWQTFASQAERQAWIAADLQSPVQLHGAPLAHAALQQCEGRLYAYLRAHHLLLDGAGFALLWRRLLALLATPAAQLDAQAHSLRLRDASQWQAWLAEGESEAAQQKAAQDLAWWRAQLQSWPAAPALSLLAPDSAPGNPLDKLSAASIYQAPPLPPAQQARLAQLLQQRCREWRCDAGALLLTVYAAWLQTQYSAHPLRLGAPHMQRFGSVALDLPCMCMNILPLALPAAPLLGDLPGALQAVQSAQAQLRRHSAARHEALQALLPAAQSLFGPVFNFLPFSSAAGVARHASGAIVEPALYCSGADGLSWEWQSNAALADCLPQWHASLQAALLAWLQAPQQSLRALQPGLAARAQLDGAALDAPAPDVLQALLSRIASRPHEEILQDGARSYTGAALLDAVRQRAAQFAALGLGQGHRVGLLLARSDQAIICQLAALWRGVTFLPLDCQQPAARLQQLLQDADLDLLLHDGAAPGLVQVELPCLALANLAPADRQQAGPPCLAPTLPAYQLYTSGSTGAPNGVLLGRAALAHFIAAAAQRYAVQHGSRILQFAPLHFDASQEEIWFGLLYGCLILRDADMHTDLAAFLQRCEDLRITLLDLPTAFWAELAHALAHQALTWPASVRCVIIGGEAAQSASLAWWRAHVPPTVRLINTYGPTETCIVCCSHDLQDASEQVALGAPLPGLSLALVENIAGVWHTVRQGGVGELAILGPTLGQYWRRAELQAQRFVQIDTGHGLHHAYLSGDLARQGADGLLYYLGRRDWQVKIGGMRVDLLEVENALRRQLPQAQQVALLAQDQKIIACYAAPQALSAPQLHSVQSALAQELPRQALPSHWLQMDALPKNANGKLDRRALLAAWGAQQAPAAAQDGADQLATALAAMWRETLGASPAAQDDFFAQGGQSLQAIRLANRLAALLGRPLPAALLYRHPRFADLLQALHQMHGQNSSANQVCDESEYAALLPIATPAHAVVDLFCLPPGEGLGWCYRPLAASFPHWRIHALQAQCWRGAALDWDAQVQLWQDLIAQHSTTRRIYLLGWSSGGGYAFELAARLRRQYGARIAGLCLLDAYPAPLWADQPAPDAMTILQALADLPGAVPAQTYARAAAMSEAELRAALLQPGAALHSLGAARLAQLEADLLQAMQAYRNWDMPQLRGVPMQFIQAKASSARFDALSWAGWQRGALQTHVLDCEHNALCQPAMLAQWAGLLQQAWASPLHGKGEI